MKEPDYEGDLGKIEESKEALDEAIDEREPEERDARARIAADGTIRAEMDTSGIEVGEIVAVDYGDGRGNREFEVESISENGVVELRPLRAISDETIEAARAIAKGEAPPVIGKRDLETGEVPYLNVGTETDPNYVPLNRRNRKILEAKRRKERKRRRKRRRKGKK